MIFYLTLQKSMLNRNNLVNIPLLDVVFSFPLISFEIFWNSIKRIEHILWLNFRKFTIYFQFGISIILDFYESTSNHFCNSFCFIHCFCFRSSTIKEEIRQVWSNHGFCNVILWKTNWTTKLWNDSIKIWTNEET